MARHFAVLGSPIAHSKSPAIHTLAYDELGLDWDYQKFEVGELELAGFLADANDFSGFSLTMPLKEQAAKLAQNRSQDVLLTGAANTLLRVDGAWNAFNTDIFGIQKALRNVSLSTNPLIAVLGSGATAKSALVAISKDFPSARVILVARSLERASILSSFGTSLGLQCEVAKADTDIEPDLMISTLPPAAFDDLRLAFPRLRVSGTLFDVAYSPWPSQAAIYWLAAGLSVVSGIEMLIWQAIAQIRLFLNGTMDTPLVDEAGLAAAMLHAAA